jgi:shikimate dehydrogenase
MHNAAFAALGIDAVFVALAVPPGKAVAAVRGLAAAGLLGVSVTVPHKTEVVAACDHLEGLARVIGAVNCVSFGERGVVGHNTDGIGFVDALKARLAYTVAEKRAVLLGAGGAARAVSHALLQAGAAQVSVLARAPGEVSWTAALSFQGEVLGRLLPETDLLVDCTPTGLVPGGEASLPAEVPLDLLPASAVVSSLVYHREPELLNRARNRGLPILDGAGMLVHQGARAFRIWTGREPPVTVMWRALCGDGDLD